MMTNSNRTHETLTAEQAVAITQNLRAMGLCVGVGQTGGPVFYSVETTRNGSAYTHGDALELLAGVWTEGGVA